jgi:pSer/pThr/pTyr-binding forkhead associated (FHA) protein
MEQFLTASGATGPLRIEIECPGQPGTEQLSFLQPFAVIGRDDRADVQLAHDLVSRRHAYLQVIGGRVFWIDLESRTGVRRGGGPEKCGWLDRDATIGVGPYRVRVGVGDGGDAAAPDLPIQAPNPLAPPPEPGDRQPRPVLQSLSRTNKYSAWPMDCVLALVGRSSGCNFQLADLSVSRFHCSLLNTPAGVWVVDLLGKEGVRVNGAEVRCARLEDGDDLRIGGFLIRVRYDESPGPAARASPAGVPSTWPAWPPARPPAAGPGETAWPPQVVEPGQGLTEWLPASPALVDGLLVPLVRQFGLIQQQISEQIHQSMYIQQKLAGQIHQVMDVVQTLGAVQRDQVTIVREELTHLGRLTRELQSLQAESLRRPPALSKPATSATADDARDRLEVARPRDDAQPSPLLPEAVPGGPTPANGLSAPVEGHPRDAAICPVGPAPTGADEGPSPAPESGQAVAEPGVISDEAFHSAIYRRITKIQHERQSHWERILKVMTGR